MAKEGAVLSRADPAWPGPVAAAVCNYQGEQHLVPCLDALLAQTRPLESITVYDNASSDASERIVRERYPGVRWVAMGDNRGPCPARNRGLEEAKGAWVLLVDNDAVLAPDVVEKLVAAARERPGSALVQPRSVFDADPSVVHYDGGGFHYVGLFSLRNFGVPLASAEGARVEGVDGAVSVVLLAERATVLDAGGFDERYFVLFEDLDLSWRLRLRGRTIWSVEDALVRHRGGTAGISFRGSVSYPRRRAFLHSRNRWMFLAEGLRWRTLIASLPGLAAYELAWTLFALRTGTILAHLQGKLAFLRELPRSLKKRKHVERSRRARDKDLLVGGPLTVSPNLRGPGGSSGALRALDGWLAWWWSVARRFAG
jgi:GT2 family glycosyltransferase